MLNVDSWKQVEGEVEVEQVEVEETKDGKSQGTREGQIETSGI